MLPETPMRIAILTHSTNPRGGVVHCLELAEALTKLGHDVVLHAPSQNGQDFFRTTYCETRLIPEQPAIGNLLDRVRNRINTFVNWFSEPDHRGFDVYHAHDGIGANALLELQQQKLIPGYLRTVHHLENSFGDPTVDALEMRSIRNATTLLAVSPSWAEKLRDHTDLQPIVVGNGVNTSRFSPFNSYRDEILKNRLGIGNEPIFLAVGGIEARKNTVNTLKAFAKLRTTIGDARLVVAGGASLLDHGKYRQRFEEVLTEEKLWAEYLVDFTESAHGNAPVLVTGVMADQEMPSLYRIAKALVFPSLVEGFGLAIIEAMASGVPTIVSDSLPFTDFLGKDDCLWANPLDPSSISDAMRLSLMPGTRDRLIRAGSDVAKAHDWASCAQAHVHAYAKTVLPTTLNSLQFKEVIHA